MMPLCLSWMKIAHSMASMSMYVCVYVCQTSKATEGAEMPRVAPEETLKVAAALKPKELVEYLDR